MGDRLRHRRRQHPADDPAEQEPVPGAAGGTSGRIVSAGGSCRKLARGCVM